MEEYIYWEQQDSDMLCAVYALNSLLQGPHWNAVSLASISQELDHEEKSLISEGSQAYSAENVGESGDFSVQALQRALESYGLACDYYNSQMKRGEDPVNEKAFICHREAHWFTLRKLKNTWYNLNSLNEQPGPQRIGEFYLSALLDNIQSDGYTIFVIRGEYPETQKDFWPELNENQFWVPKSLLDSNIRDESQDDIAKAIEESLRSQESQPDPELEFAILLSMQEEQDRLVQPSLQVQDVLEILPEYQGESAFLLRLRLPDGKLETKYFLPECKLEDVKNWGKFISKREVQLVEPYPRRVLTELSQSLLETGLGPLNNFLILEYI